MSEQGRRVARITSKKKENHHMHVHIIYCHPSENSLTAQVRDAFIRGLKDSGKTHTVSDLYKKGFQTDMTEAEYMRDAFYTTTPLAAGVIEEQSLINAADALVFIYPVFGPKRRQNWSAGLAVYGHTVLPTVWRVISKARLLPVARLMAA
jgi:NAD(P)H dehydrogenase (quinone)